MSIGRASRPSSHRDGDVAHREVGVPDEERPGAWQSALNSIGFVREPMSANVPAVSHILLGVFGKGWVGPGSWLADALIHNLIGSETPMALIGGEALRAGSATVGVEQGMLRKDFLVDGVHTRSSSLPLTSGCLLCFRHLPRTFILLA